MPKENRNEREDLALDVDALRRKLGPTRVALIEQWIQEVNGPLNAAIGDYVRPDSVVLDAGCSRGDPDLPALQKGRLLIGCDVDLPGLRANDMAHGCVAAPVGRLPFRDATFDAVVCKWVFEHLEAPAEDFAEFDRVLKPGGVLIALTPNGHGLFACVSRMTPYRFKQVFKNHVFGVHEEDTFRTWYRANTPKQLERVADGTGLRLRRLEYLPGMWTFLIFNRYLARAVRRFELCQKHVPGLRAATTYLMGVWRKEPPHPV